MTDNRWTLLETRFRSLLAIAPPVQVRRIKSLHEFANLQDRIEEAEFLLSIALELVALQTKVERRENEIAVYESALRVD